MTKITSVECNKLKALIERFGNPCPLNALLLAITVKHLFMPGFIVAGGKRFQEVAQTMKYLRSLVVENGLENIDELVALCDKMDNETLQAIIQQ